MGLSMSDRIFAGVDSLKKEATQIEAELNSLKLIEQNRLDSLNKEKIYANFQKTPSRLDDNLHLYVADDDSDQNYVVHNFNNTGQSIDISKIYEALDQISIENPEHSALIDQITDTDNWMYTTDTPKESGKTYQKINEGLIAGGYKGSDPEKYKSWTAANAFGVGVADFTDNEYFQFYNEEMEKQYDILNKEENPWGPNIFQSSVFINENIIGGAIEDRFGTEAWVKADAIASEKAKEQQLLAMKGLAEDHPDGNKWTSLLKSLEYLENYKNQ
jgi:hypothetical protein